MRIAMATVAALGLALAACQPSDDPSAKESGAAQTDTGEAPEADAVTLRGDGLAAGAESFYFGAGRSEVEAGVTSALGEPTERGDNAECGAGPVQFTIYPGDLHLNFQDGKLVGWLVQDGNSSPTIRTAQGVGIGTPAQDAAARIDAKPVEGSTLDGEFAAAGDIGGFFRQAGGAKRVTGLYAGTNCFAR